MGKIEIDVSGEFDATTEAILAFLYAHPDGDYGTYALVRELKPELPDGASDEQRQQAFKEVQYGIETLIVAKFVKGRRLRTASGDGVSFEELKLTPNGEAEAIKQKRRLKKVVISGEGDK